MVPLLSVAVFDEVVTGQVVAAGAGPVVVVGDGGMMALVVRMEQLAVEARDGLGSLRKPMDRKVRAVVGVAVVVAVVAVVCVDPVDNPDLILYHLVPCNFLTEFGHMQELQQRSYPLPPGQRWQRQLKIVLYLAEDAAVR